MRNRAPTLLTIAGFAVWSGAFLASGVPAYLDQQQRYFALIGLGGVLFAAAGGLALWRAR